MRRRSSILYTNTQELQKRDIAVCLHAQEFVTTRPGDKEPVCGRQEYSVTEDRPIEKVQS